MVILKENHQIIENSMEENVIIRRKGGGSIIDRKPLFSPDGKYVYLLCGWCVRAYSTLTGECIRQFVPQDLKKNDILVSLAVEDCFVFALSAKGYLTKWRYNATIPLSKMKIKIKKSSIAVDIVLLKSGTDDNEYECCVLEKEADKEVKHLALYNSQTGQLVQSLFVSADNTSHSVAFGKAGSDHYVAAIKHNRVTVFYVKNKTKSFSSLAGNNRTWTAVACHPEECIVASGDNTGRIVVWRQPIEGKQAPKAVFHWHTLPVNDVVFSASGSYMYSGGGEGVMVKWNVDSPNMRSFLPRLPAPVVHLSISDDNQIIAISTADNGIQLVDAQNRVFCAIQNLTWGVNTTKEGTLFPVGLAWDPLTKCLVLNGRCGHLQFYNPEYNKLLYNLDITGQNYITQERNKEIINTDITHAALTADGKWMVTVETRNDKETSIEVWLKFWQYKFNTRQFSLNTCVELPHYGPVNCVRFQPLTTPPSDSEDLQDYLLVTTGNDKKFRLWAPTETDSIYKDGVRWGCDSIGFYRDQLAGCVSFSSDGSLLGVIFGPTLTIWDVETNQMKTTLTRDNNDLRFVQFGQKDCSHLVVTTNTTHLHVWNILTLTVLWSVPLQVSVLTSDMSSPYMSIFTKTNKLFVFTPASPTPVYEKKDICSEGIVTLAAIFIPRTQPLHQCRTPWLVHSQLHYIDSNQELLFVDLEGEGVDEKHADNVMESDAPATPFSILVAKETTTAVQKVDSSVKHTQFGVLGGETVRQLLSAPAHTMPHISSLCSAFLRSLLLTKQKQENAEKNLETESTANNREEDTSSDDETPPTVIVHKQPNPDKKKKRKRTRKLSNASKSSSRNSFSFDDSSIWPLTDVFTE